jgi:hypothetical protein
LDKNPDARSKAGSTQAAPSQTNQPLPTNRDAELKKLREKQAKKQAKYQKKKSKDQNQHAADEPKQSQATQGAQTPLGTPNAVPAAPNPASVAPESQNPPQSQ